MHSEDGVGVCIPPECSIWPRSPSRRCFLKLDASSSALLLQSSVACLKHSFPADTSTQLLQLHILRQNISALERFENQTCPPFCLRGSQSVRGQMLIPRSLKSWTLHRILYRRDDFIPRCREVQSSRADNACRPQGVYYPLSLGYFRSLEKERGQQ